MSDNKWKIRDKTLGYLRGEEFIVPAASDICNLVFKNDGSLTDLPIDSTIRKLFHLDSKIMSDRGILIDLDDENDNFRIVWSQACRKRDGTVIKLPHDYEADHIIDKDVWIPFQDENWSTITVPFLKSLDVIRSCEIKLGQYFELLTNQDNFSFIKNLVVNRLDAENLGSKGVYLKPEGFILELRPYQQKGFAWLNMLAEEGLGSILADEMALGKTAQLIALVCHRKSLNKGKVLVICPITLLENWKREFEKFSEGISVVQHYGLRRTHHWTNFDPFDVVITNFDSVVADLPMFKMIHWDMVIIDEAVDIKNPDAVRTQKIKQLKRNLGIAVTGTPMENRLEDLWSLMNFANPSFLGTIESFREAFENTEEGARKLQPIIGPLKLRRLQKDVLTDLPEKIEIYESLIMSSGEAEGYNTLRQKVKQSQVGPNLEVLRQFACYPQLPDENFEDKIGYFDPIVNSIKFRRLRQLLEKIFAANEKVLVFAKYINMLKLIQNYVQNFMHVPSFIMTGSMPKDPMQRQALVDQLSACDGAAILSMNPIVGGSGLNITCANNVIHYMPEWTSTKTDQATFRVLRPGQKKKVRVYHLSYTKTVEEALKDCQDRKRAIIGEVVTENRPEDEILEPGDLLRALNMNPLS